MKHSEIQVSQNSSGPELYFSTLREEEKLLCSLQLVYAAPFDSYLAGWLVNKLSREDVISNGLSRQSLEVTLTQMVERGLMVPARTGCELNQRFIDQAFAWPLQNNKHRQIIDAVRQLVTASEFSGQSRYTSESERALIASYYLGNPDFEERPDFSYLEEEREAVYTLTTRLVFPFEEQLFSLLPEASQVHILAEVHAQSLLTFDGVFSDSESGFFKYFLQPRWLKSPIFLLHGAHVMAERLIFQGDFQRAKTYLEFSTSPEAPGLHALILFLFHGHEAALPAFRNALREIRKSARKKTSSFRTLADPFYFIALIQNGSPECLQEAKQHQDKLLRSSLLYPPFYLHLRKLYDARISGRFEAEQIFGQLEHSGCLLNNFFGLLVLRWLGVSDSSLYEKPLNQVIMKARGAGFQLPACESLRLKSNLNLPLNKEEETLIETWNDQMMMPLAEVVERRAPWEMVLEALSSTLNLAGSRGDASERLIWEIRLNLPRSFEISAREQTRLKSGKWSAGKQIDNHRYFNGMKPFPDYYTLHDQNIFKALQNVRPWLRCYDEDDEWEVFAAMIGHPNVFFAHNDQQPVEILRGEPVLLLNRNTEGFQLIFQPEFNGRRVVVNQEADYRLRVYEFTEVQIKAAKVLENNQLFPPVALNRLKQTIAGLSPLMPVHTGIEGTENLTPIASVAANNQIYAQLVPAGDGLKIKLCVRPFGDKGPGFVPGRGMHDVFTEIAGQKLHTQRNLATEVASAESLISHCPSLDGIEKADFAGELATAEDALQLLLELQQVDNLQLEWPANHRPTRVSRASFGNFRFKINGRSDWFELSGELNVDDGQVLELQELLKLYDGHSRFIRLGEDRVLAITEDFRRRINDLRGFTDQKGGVSSFHISAIAAVESLFEDVQEITFDRTWKEAQTRLKNAAEKKFEIPSTLTAELREYQREAYYWLSRMAYLGMGACLADDMGLGKTVEALALLLSRAADGPAFVLAPTSVCMNWYNETRRFAPTLNPVLFAQSDRRETIRNLAPYDLVICSYGVLQNEIEAIAAVNWSTIVLDEAQAIKNMATNRSQAVMLLQGRFKMLMTGTPIENHLGELWNLFRFLNPGLLGSVERFNETFATPIQSSGDKLAQMRLKKLVQPFILRRTKSQVLQDLPPRTEITLQVDLSREETALYESMRRNAIEKISTSEGESGRPMLVLAEIMRLRRLCCNPALVAPESGIASSKMQLLENIVEELIENRHKALIFSQFVDHLTLVRQLFDRKGLSYQYLDGSTPVKARTKAISAFQEGNGDFFLISLKAGGLGLNLTAADYVIHLDPWWNPAVEDQASDRAHRIGQTRPVTIYRLITTNTIEEKILQLHGRKRDLADGLLDGSDIAGRISTAELVALISSSIISSS
ncbi:MAG TPA: DEAD/DEAH box helicase [Candidatus Rifleibacterium sp.]|nr:DEAD/DEAH box helicase [Candidatus Rifleibacterium sp.]